MYWDILNGTDLFKEGLQPQMVQPEWNTDVTMIY